MVQTQDGRIYHQNRRHLIQSSQEHPDDNIELDTEFSDRPEVAPESTDACMEPTLTQTSPGCIVKTPARYKDFVTT